MEEFNSRAVKHLYLRAGFGLPPWSFEKEKKITLSAVIEKLFNEAKIATDLQLDKELHSPKYYAGDMMMQGKMSREQKKELAKQSAMDEKDMNLKWVDKMAEGGLREKMTLFWHGHFACTEPISLYALMLNNTIRKNALGNFGDMLLAVAREPAMLRFLNNQQNKKQSPNENFAREVMELFTIGRGNYTEDDIKNAARAFTGWTTDADGNFIKRPFQHDDGVKTFMGHTGNFDGEDIMKIILSRKETANFIASKVYKYFVNQDNPDTDIIAKLGAKFYDSDYDISVLMHEIFASDWFYNEKNMGNRIKSPIELIVGLKRDFKIEFENPEVVLGLQKLLGQVLFHPPNVSGWAGGRNWIDSSSLLYRMRIPESIFYTSEMNVTVKGDAADNAMMYEMNKKVLKLMKNTADLSYYNERYKDKTAEQVVDELSVALLAPGARNIDKPLIVDYAQRHSSDVVRSSIMLITSLPEYQLS